MCVLWIGPLHTLIYLFHSSDSHCHRCMALNRKETIRCVAKLIFIYFVQKYPTKSGTHKLVLILPFSIHSFWVGACSVFKYMNTKFHIQAVRSYLWQLKTYSFDFGNQKYKRWNEIKSTQTHMMHMCAEGEKKGKPKLCAYSAYTLFQAFGFSVTLSSLFNLSGFANIFPKVLHSKTEKMCLAINSKSYTMCECAGSVSAHFNG